MVLEEILFIMGSSFSEFFFLRLCRKKEPTTYFKWIKIQRNHATYMITFLWPANIPTFIKIILIVFHFCLKLVSLRIHKIFDFIWYFGKLNVWSLMWYTHPHFSASYMFSLFLLLCNRLLNFSSLSWFDDKIAFVKQLFSKYFLLLM